MSILATVLYVVHAIGLLLFSLFVPKTTRWRLACVVAVAGVFVGARVTEHHFAAQDEARLATVAQENQKQQLTLVKGQFHDATTQHIRDADNSHFDQLAYFNTRRISRLYADLSAANIQTIRQEIFADIYFLQRKLYGLRYDLAWLKHNFPDDPTVGSRAARLVQTQRNSLNELERLITKTTSPEILTQLIASLQDLIESQRSLSGTIRRLVKGPQLLSISESLSGKTTEVTQQDFERLLKEGDKVAEADYCFLSQINAELPHGYLDDAEVRQVPIAGLLH